MGRKERNRKGMGSVGSRLIIECGYIAWFGVCLNLLAHKLHCIGQPFDKIIQKEKVPYRRG